MLQIEIWHKRTGSISNHFYVEEKYINLVFFGGVWRWRRFMAWTVYVHDFIER